jgi:methionyl aminopeptidase
MRRAGQIAATTLRMACDYAQHLVPVVEVPVVTPPPPPSDFTNHQVSSSSDLPHHHHHYYQNSITTDDIDLFVHNTITQQFQSYPSPLNYASFPKSVCTSVNEVICHGIPNRNQILHYGDVISIDVSCYTSDQVHGDNCATIIVGDYNDDPPNHENTTNEKTHHPNLAPDPPLQTQTQLLCDWRNVPYRTQFATLECFHHFQQARRLMRATREALMTAISIIRPNQSYISDIGMACQMVADQYGYSSVTKYRGHGIGSEFHTAPFIPHYYNHPHEGTNIEEEEPILIRDGMIFTIEPMLCQFRPDCTEWESDHWTVTTIDRGLSCQFEHTVYVTATGVEILTLPIGHPMIGRDWVHTPPRSKS